MYNLKSYFLLSVADFTIVIWAIVAVTMVLSFKLHRCTRNVVQLFFAMFALYIGVFCYLANLQKDGDSLHRGVLER